MLVLSRKKGESIIIGDDIKVTILNNQGGSSQIGIEASPDIAIWREEIYKKNKQKEEKETK